MQLTSFTGHNNKFAGPKINKNLYACVFLKRTCLAYVRGNVHAGYSLSETVYAGKLCKEMYSNISYFYKWIQLDII